MFENASTLREPEAEFSLPALVPEVQPALASKFSGSWSLGSPSTLDGPSSAVEDEIPAQDITGQVCRRRRAFCVVIAALALEIKATEHDRPKARDEEQSKAPRPCARIQALAAVWFYEAARARALAIWRFCSRRLPSDGESYGRIAAGLGAADIARSEHWQKDPGAESEAGAPDGAAGS